MGTIRSELSNIADAISRQETVSASAICAVVEKTKALKLIPGSAEADMEIINEADKIRQQALAALEKYLG